MDKAQKKATFFAFLAAILYAVNSPFSKLLLDKVSATVMAAFLYLGAGLGLCIMGGVQRLTGKAEQEQPLTKKELPFTVLMVLLDIAAPIFLMLGLSMTTAANASLLNNFEIYLLDAAHDGELLTTTDTVRVDMPVHSVVLVKEI